MAPGPARRGFTLFIIPARKFVGRIAYHFPGADGASRVGPEGTGRIMSRVGTTV